MKSTTPIPIAVSACLLGWRVRYDGKDKAHAWVRALFATDAFVPVPVCPEVLAGLGIPRPPVELVLEEGQVKALGVSDRRLDVTRSLSCHAGRWLDRIPAVAGMICKSRSPSCGLRVALHNRRGQDLGLTGEGLFIRVLRQRLPALPIIEETALTDRRRRNAFLDQVRAYTRR